MVGGPVHSCPAGRAGSPRFMVCMDSAAMPRHYLKISKRLRPYASKVATLDDDWRRTIFSDLTHGGRELHIVHVPPNEQGPLIGLCGEQFFCHAGQDKHNAFSLFISRITPSSFRPNEEPPTRIVGEFELITEADWDPPPRDPVKPLFQQALVTSAPEPPRPPRPPDDASTPSDALLRVLEAGGTELRQLWTDTSPTSDDSDSVPQTADADGVNSSDSGGTGPLTTRSGTEILSMLKALWNRFRLEEYAELDPRPLALLKGTITPSSVSEADCNDMAAAFGIATLNAMVQPLHASGKPPTDELAQQTRTQTLALVRELARVPLSTEVHERLTNTVMHATSRSLVPGELRQVVQRWLVRQCGVVPTHLQRQRTEIADKVQQWLTRSRHEDSEDLLGYVQQLARLQADVTRFLDALPDLDQIDQRKREAERAYVSAMRTMGDATVQLLEREPELSAGALLEIAALASQDRKLAALPPWLWSTSVSYEAEVVKSQQLVWCYHLADDARRARIRHACDRLDRLDSGLFGLLSRYPAPSADTTAESHFVRAVEQFGGLPGTAVAEFADLSEEHIGWVCRALDGSWPADRVIAIVKAVDGFRDRMNAASIGKLLADLESIVSSGHSVESVELRIGEYNAAIEQIEGLFGSARDATWAQLEQLTRRLTDSRDREIRATPTSKPVNTGPLLRFDHNWVDETGRRVPLVLVPYGDRERPYGVIRVPLVVRTPAPREVACELEVEISSSLHKNWPDGWERPSPRSLRISAHAWRESGDEALYTFHLEVPLRLPKSEKESVDIELRALDSKNGWPVSERKRLRWSRISMWKGEIPFSWPDTVQPQFVQQHPIGPQRRYEDIVDRLIKGGSFAVVAPRRFGKTTLVEYLHESAKTRGLAIAPPVVCTSVVAEYGIDHAALWRQVSTGFHELLGVGLEGIPGDTPSQGMSRQTAATSAESALSTAALPHASAFQSVRRVARERGLSAVVVLFDEAQLLFSGQDGERLGNAFKDRLERSWSRGDLPPVAIGFIGLPGLRDRAGANLMGILRPYQGRRVEERALNRLILQITAERLSTTREARHRLASQAGNLYMLKTLLDRLVRHVNHERRTWAAFQDVRRVEHELRQELERGETGDLHQYMRDPLNRSENINVWEPHACFPVAVALAAIAVKVPHASPLEQNEAAARMLDTWCQALGRETGHTLTFPKKRIDEHKASLRDLGLWDGDEFVSGIVQSWLCGVSHTFPMSDADRRTLIRAALPRIRIPVDREMIASTHPDDDGRASDAQASNGTQTFRFVRDDITYTMLQVPLTSEARRRRFIQRLDALQLVGERRRRAEPGSEYLFSLENAGIADDGDIGVATHRWVDGMDLGSSRGHLDTALVLEMGVKLASALRLLHAHDVVHEHVSPGHIVVERATARPIMIDFGLSRIGHSNGANDSSGARLTKSADVQALGATLNRVWNRKRADERERATMDRLFDRCNPKAKNQVDAAGLLRLLDDAGEKLHVYSHTEEAWREIVEAATPALGKRWFRDFLVGFRPYLLALRFGLHSDAFARGCELATFLARLLEAQPTHVAPDSHEPAVQTLLSLSALRIRAAPTVDLGRVSRELDIPDESALHALLSQGARAVAKTANIDCLPRLVQLLRRERG